MIVLLLGLVACFGQRELSGGRYDPDHGCFVQDTLVVDNFYWWTFDSPCKDNGLWVPMADGTCWDLGSDCRHGPIDDPAVSWSDTTICTEEVRFSDYCDDLLWPGDTGDTGDTGESGDTAGE